MRHSEWYLRREREQKDWQDKYGAQVELCLSRMSWWLKLAMWTGSVDYTWNLWMEARKWEDTKDLYDELSKQPVRYN